MIYVLIYRRIEIKRFYKNNVKHDFIFLEYNYS